MDKVQKGDLSTISSVSEGALQQPEDVFRRSYAMREFRQRLHQNAFRERVLIAYRDQCALCRLRHRELLDAAHIIPDNEPGGEPVVKTVLPYANFTMPHSTNSFLALDPMVSSSSEMMSFWNLMVPCCATGSRVFIIRKYCFPEKLNFDHLLIFSKGDGNVLKRLHSEFQYRSNSP